jgi:hypothetical protein
VTDRNVLPSELRSHQLSRVNSKTNALKITRSKKLNTFTQIIFARIASLHDLDLVWIEKMTDSVATAAGGPLTNLNVCARFFVALRFRLFTSSQQLIPTEHVYLLVQTMLVAVVTLHLHHLQIITHHHHHLHLQHTTFFFKAIN